MPHRGVHRREGGRPQPAVVRHQGVRAGREGAGGAGAGFQPEKALEEHIQDCEKELDDDAESIITNQRYAYINGLVSKSVKKHGEKHRLSTSDKIDQIVTNRILALPIFAVVMFAVYWIAMGPFGTFLTDWTNDVLGTAWLVDIPRAALEAGASMRCWWA